MFHFPSGALRPLAAATALCLAPLGAQADVLADTYGPGGTTGGINLGLGRNAVGKGVSLAVPFSAVEALTVDGVLAAINTFSGSVTLGLMADSAGVPDGSFVHSLVLATPTTGVALTGLGWDVAAGSWWLAAVPANDTQAQWTVGHFGLNRWALASDISATPGWDAQGAGAPAVRITSAVPEPQAWALWLGGAALLAAGRRRRARG